MEYTVPTLLCLYLAHDKKDLIPDLKQGHKFGLHREIVELTCDIGFGCN